MSSCAHILIKISKFTAPSRYFHDNSLHCIVFWWLWLWHTFCVDKEKAICCESIPDMVISTKHVWLIINVRYGVFRDSLTVVGWPTKISYIQTRLLSWGSQLFMFLFHVRISLDKTKLSIKPTCDIYLVHTLWP